MGATTHNHCQASKASLPTLTKDTKKQPTGTIPLSVTAALQLTHSQEDSSRCSDNSSYEEPLSPISASSSTSRWRQGLRDLELPDMLMRDLAGMGHHFLSSEPTMWYVDDVYEFIRSLPGCQEITGEFRGQEINGQALLLLKEDHLMSAINIKLGPALKIYMRSSMLNEQGQWREGPPPTPRAVGRGWGGGLRTSLVTLRGLSFCGRGREVGGTEDGALCL